HDLAGIEIVVAVDGSIVAVGAEIGIVAIGGITITRIPIVIPAAEEGEAIVTAPPPVAVMMVAVPIAMTILGPVAIALPIALVAIPIALFAVPVALIAVPVPLVAVPVPLVVRPIPLGCIV